MQEEIEMLKAKIAAQNEDKSDEEKEVQNETAKALSEDGECVVPATIEAIKEEKSAEVDTKEEKQGEEAPKQDAA